MITFHKGIFPPESVGTFSHCLVGLMPKPPLEMTKGIQVGYQLDKALPAVLVEFANILSRKRGSFPPDDLVVTEGEGVLDVELQFVVAQIRKKID